MITTLTDKQYSVLLDFFHEFPEQFYNLPQDVLNAYFARLYAK